MYCQFQIPLSRNLGLGGDLKKREDNNSMPLSFKGIKTYSLKGRKSKVKKDDLTTPYTGGSTFKEFLNTLPGVLGAKDLRSVAAEVAKAHTEGRTVITALGAHVIKVGLSGIVIDLMERGVIKGVALNGAGIIHDFELAYAGMTSEDVDAEIDTGLFGMAEETGRILNGAIKKGAEEGLGIGRAIGKKILSSNYPNKALSILAAGERLKIPVTVHVGIGTDIIHMHPGSDGGAIGKASMMDFRILCNELTGLQGGVYINIGSAVILPEVFLKAITVVRNLGYKVEDFTTVNMDFMQHYRPVTNVVRRPTQKGGRGYAITGHHEIMLPLLAAAIIEEIG